MIAPTMRLSFPLNVSSQPSRSGWTGKRGVGLRDGGRPLRALDRDGPLLDHGRRRDGPYEAPYGAAARTTEAGGHSPRRHAGRSGRRAYGRAHNAADRGRRGQGRGPAPLTNCTSRPSTGWYARSSAKAAATGVLPWGLASTDHRHDGVQRAPGRGLLTAAAEARRPTSALV